MSREIKFRAWNPYRERMLPSSPLYEIVAGGIFPSQCYDHLMQYTGLKDKNDVEIYEGDIVLIDNADTNDHGQYVSLPSKVFYDAGCFNVFPDYDEELLLSVADKCTVIGNIYENPELLEKTAA